MKENANSLLKQVEKIIEKHDAIDKVTGAKFNIFTILERDHSETRHSRFLAELLNPKGSHGQGNIYLKLFYETLEDEFKERWFEQNVSFNLEAFADKALVYTEQSNGENGLIDIIIETTTHAIIIENKIYAGDQDKQLERYAQSKKNKNILIIYLTLDGYQPSQKSLGMLKVEEVVLLSYAIHIIKWLKACINQSATLPAIRETLLQYVKLLQKMTYQTGDVMEREMIELLLKDGNLKAAQEISNVLNKARATLEAKFWFQVNKLLIPYITENSFQEKEYSEQEIMSFVLARPKCGDSMLEFWYARQEYQKGRYFNFGIGCDNIDNRLYIGCYPINQEHEYLQDSCSECIKLLENPFETNKHYVYFGEKRDFFGEGIYELLDAKQCNELAQETVNDLIPILKKLKIHVDDYFNKK
jgi:hypothetical protein